MSYTIPLEPGKIYHLYNRGNNGENIFIAERNYGYFLNLYVKHITPVAETFAYSLLKNHFHFLTRIRDQIEPPTASKAFSNLFNAYTKSINKMYGRTGALFQRAFQRIEVASPNYCLRLVHYIHWNPQRHGFVKDFRDWPYSSYHALLSDQATFLRREEVIGWFNNKIEFDAIHQTLTEEKSSIDLIGDGED